MLTIREATIEDVNSIAPLIRAEDVSEVFALTGKSMEEVLPKSFESSLSSYVAEDEEGLVCIFGLSEMDDDPNVGIPWLLGTDKLFSNKKALIKTSRMFRDEFLSKYRVLTNVIDERNERSIRWLHHLGFEFPVVLDNFGYEKRTFLQFVRYRDV